jgi:presenilin-like A22 family membrane protease
MTNQKDTIGSPRFKTWEDVTSETKKVAFYASLLYILIFSTAFLYNAYVIKPLAITKAFGVGTEYVQATHVDATSSSFNYYTIETIVAEVIILTILVLIEMKFKLFSRLLAWLNKYPYLRTIVLVLFVGGVLYESYLASAGSLVIIGFLTLVFMVSAYFWRKVKRKIAALMVLFNCFIAWIILIPLGQIASPSLAAQGELMLLSATILIAFFIIMVRRLESNKSLKNTLNTLGVFMALTTAIYFGISISPYFAIAILIALSIYDYLAVFKLQTMQFIAKKAISQLVPALLIFGDENEVEMKLARITDSGGQQTLPIPPEQESHSAILGLGDIVFPSVIITSFIFYETGTLAFLMLIGAIAGMLLDMVVLSGWHQKEKLKKGLPALPLICLAQVILFGLGMIL